MSQRAMAEGWQLALEQQADLSITDGGTAALAAAVRRGADLRVYMTTDRYEETIYFQQTYAGAGDRCAGLMSHHHGYVHHGRDVEQPNMSIFRYDTSGTFEQMKWLWGDRALNEGQTFPMASTSGLPAIAGGWFTSTMPGDRFAPAISMNSRRWCAKGERYRSALGSCSVWSRTLPRAPSTSRFWRRCNP